jgi:hypothetical protein
MGKRTKDPPQADMRDSLSQLVLRLVQAIDLANKKGDPALVGPLQEALEIALRLQEYTIRPTTNRGVKEALAVLSAEAIKYMLDEIIETLIELGLHSIF